MPPKYHQHELSRTSTIDPHLPSVGRMPRIPDKLVRITPKELPLQEGRPCLSCLIPSSKNTQSSCYLSGQGTHSLLTHWFGHSGLPNPLLHCRNLTLLLNHQALSTTITTILHR
ncbi:hypothetical protein HYC85_028698 [Camellia sinensis]|uniref:Uncharacterized protein n=1 Tax=Camellia sinensis TaxID=4442 RepID=A0A7J7FWM0_CAMSI|nr:hypothetical protein HYC85_028698 [Camellia sinensis]